MSAPVSLPGHVVFRELPFCGVLLDTRCSRVYRLSQEATRVLRHALEGAQVPGPYEPVISVQAPEPTAEQRDRLLTQLSSQGLVRVDPNANHGDAA
jgi:hypothetical protein